MKKTLGLTLLAVLAAPVITGCDFNLFGSGYKETRTEEEVVTALGEELALELKTLYSDYASTGVNYGDTKLVTSYNKKVWEGDLVGLNYEVVFDLTKKDTELTETFLTINEAKDTLTAGIVTKNDLTTTMSKSLEAAAYTLSWKIKFVNYGEEFKVKGLTPTGDMIGKEVAKGSCSALVKLTTLGSITEIKKCADDSYVMFYGQFTAWYSNAYDQLYSGAFITNGNDGVMIYAGSITTDFFNDDETLKIQPGAYVRVYGYVSCYNGLFEVKPKQIIEVEDQEIIEGIAAPTYTTMTVLEANASETKDTGKLIKIEGLTLAETQEVAIADLSIGEHWTLKALDAEQNELQIRVNYHIGDEAQEAIKNVLVNLGTSTFSISGVLSCYSNIEICPVNTASSSAATSIVAE